MSAAWLKLLDQRCTCCGGDRFFLAHARLSTLVFCDRCGALFEERPIGRHRVIDHFEPQQLTLNLVSS
jgi:hypothetical protein